MAASGTRGETVVRCRESQGMGESATHENRPIRWMHVLAIAVAALLAAPAAQRLMAQEMPPETQAPAPAQSMRPQTRVRPGAARPALQQAPEPAETAAAEPAANNGAAQPSAETPQWPINEKAGQPMVTWDSHGLSIDAANSSLQQILKDVSVATGAKVEGMTGDQRIFGIYGPAPARDVLSQLLQGAGYNVIMVGDLGEGTPRQILLSVRRADTGSQAPNANQGDDNSGDDDSGDNDADDQQQVQPPIRPGFPGGFPRTPQQLLEERQRMMQERQQMIQQQMQQQQQNTPQN